VAVKTKIIKPKAKAKAKRKRAKTTADWDAQEAAEAPIKKASVDVINQLVGREIYKAACSEPGWKSKGMKIFVSRFYPHANQIVDFPRTGTEEKLKKDFFKKVRIAYACVSVGEQTDMETLAKRIKASRRILKGRPRNARQAH